MVAVESQRHLTEAVASQFVLHHKLGAGSQGEVWSAQARSGREEHAVKLLPRSAEAWAEVKAYRTLSTVPRHGNVLRNLWMAIDDRSVNVVLELCGKQDLLDRVQAEPTGALSETQARRWSRDLCSAVAHLHAFDVMHLDIKLENILLQGSPGSEELKLGDFGLSAVGKPGRNLTKMCGSGIYRAPEVTLVTAYGPYDGRAADMWSVGVCMFVMVRGRFPFHSEVPLAMLTEWATDCQAVRGTPLIQPTAPAMLSSPEQRARIPPRLLSVLDRCLHLNPAERPAAAMVLRFPWLEEACADGFTRTPGYATPPSSASPIPCLTPTRSKKRQPRSQDTALTGSWGRCKRHKHKPVDSASA